jgi:hypothetical protein
MGGGGGGSYVLGGGRAYPGPQGSLAPNLGDGVVEFDFLGAAVPEPSEWVLMITGLAFTGAMLRRERNRRARAALA